MNARLATALSIVLVLAATGVRAAGEIHGTIETRDGRRPTGTIRWGEDERFWDDSFDGLRAAEPDPEADAERQRSRFRFELFGFDLTGGGDGTRIEGSLSIPFGHLRTIEPDEGGGARLLLKSGETIRVVGNSNDFGDRLEPITIADAAGGVVEVPWGEIVRVSLSASPSQGAGGECLWGTVRTSAAKLTGRIVWNGDERMRDETLDGRDPKGESRAITFREVASVVPAGPSRARLRLVSGETVELEGTEDVGRGRTEIGVEVEDLGYVEVPWGEIEEVLLTEPGASRGYEAFDGGRPLTGSVTTKQGGTVTGTIVWDRDETRSWQKLDGEAGGVDYAIPFDRIRSIRPLDGERSEVELRTGRKIVLGGTNDVDASNRGILVTPTGGRTVEIPWERVGRVEFP